MSGKRFYLSGTQKELQEENGKSAQNFEKCSDTFPTYD